MIRFHTLGTVRLRSEDGADVDAVLAQPMQVALLTYLVAARPSGFHRRDTLLGLFWPELDMAHARGALNQAVYRLRQSLGRDAIPGRGKDELGVDPSLAWSDVAAFEAAAEAGEHRTALELYGGDLLAGFFLSGAPTWERWLDAERLRLREIASAAAWRLADEAADDGRVADTGHWGRRALALDPANEASLRRLIRLLDAVGDRAGALRAYEETVTLFAAEYEATPSPETRALIEAVCEREAPRPGLADLAAATPRRVVDEREARQGGRSVAARAAIALVAIAFVATAVWFVGSRSGPEAPGTRASSPAARLAATAVAAEPAAEARREYERGRYYLSQVGSDAALEARDHFQRALDIEPTYADAWGGLAASFDNLAALRLLPADQAFPRARAAAEQAIYLEPDHTEAHAVLAWALASYYWDMEAAERQFSRALALNPDDARTRRLHAAHLRNLGRFDEALDEIRAARELDPLNGLSRIDEGVIHYMAGDYDAALTHFETFLRVAPEQRHTYMFVALAEAARGRFDASLDALDRADPDIARPVAIALRGYVYGRTGRTAEAERMRAILDERVAAREAIPMQPALVAVGLGEYDAALDLLERNLATPTQELRLLKVEPLFEPLHGNPRFEAVLEALGFAVAEETGS